MRSPGKIYSLFTTLIVFITGINCFCHSAQAAQQTQKTGCCCSTQHQTPTSNQKTSHRDCAHCQGTLIAEHAPPQNFAPSLDHFAVTPALVLPNLVALNLPLIHSQSIADSSPPLLPATLLGLHCALTL
jgi:hypothetical protein